MYFEVVVWFLWIPALIIGWHVYNLGPAISNIFYGLGSFTAIVTILCILTGEDVPSEVKLFILFLIAFVAIGIGYYMGKGSDGEEETKENVEDGKKWWMIKKRIIEWI